MCSFTFLSRTLLLQDNIAHNCIHPFRCLQLVRIFFPESSLGMLLAVTGLCFFQETPKTHLGSSFHKHGLD